MANQLGRITAGNQLAREIVTTPADGSITNAKLADMAQATIKGRASGAGTGDPQDLTGAQAGTIISPDFNLEQYHIDRAATLFGISRRNLRHSMKDFYDVGGGTDDNTTSGGTFDQNYPGGPMIVPATSGSFAYWQPRGGFLPGPGAAPTYKGYFAVRAFCDGAGTDSYRLGLVDTGFAVRLYLGFDGAVDANNMYLHTSGAAVGLNCGARDNNSHDWIVYWTALNAGNGQVFVEKDGVLLGSYTAAWTAISALRPQLLLSNNTGGTRRLGVYYYFQATNTMP